MLRSPIICVLGHVDVGKTSFLDRLRATKFQEHEAGGITQTISAWNLWKDDIHKYLSVHPQKLDENAIPGLLMIDTPGHESFSKFRSSGANLCDMALLILDINKGVQKTTIEAIEMLKQTRTPFIVVLNKIDRIHGWESQENGYFLDNIKKQKKEVLDRYNECINNVLGQFSNLLFRANVYYDNEDKRRNISLVPVSARTGEGFPDLLYLIYEYCSMFMKKRLSIKDDTMAMVMEKEYNIKGHGTGYQVILIDGDIKRGDEIIVHTLDDNFKYKVKSTLLYDYKTKSYTPDEISGCRIGTIILDDVKTDMIYPGSVITNQFNDMTEINELKVSVPISRRRGFKVWIQAPSVGALMGLSELLKNKKIAIGGYGVGPVRKNDIMKATDKVMMLVNFNSSITEDVVTFASESGLDIISDDVVYSLVDRVECERDKYCYAEEKETLACQVMVLDVKSLQRLRVHVQIGALKDGQRLFTISQKRNMETGCVDDVVVELGEIFEMTNLTHIRRDSGWYSSYKELRCPDEGMIRVDNYNHVNFEVGQVLYSCIEEVPEFKDKDGKDVYSGQERKLYSFLKDTLKL